MTSYRQSKPHEVGVSVSRGVHPEVSEEGDLRRLAPVSGDVLRRLAQRRESEVEEGHLMVDHVHLMLSMHPPKYSVADVIGRTSRGRVRSTSWKLRGAAAQFRGAALFDPRGYFSVARWGGMSRRSERTWLDHGTRRSAVRATRFDSGSHPSGWLKWPPQRPLVVSTGRV